MGWIVNEVSILPNNEDQHGLTTRHRALRVAGPPLVLTAFFSAVAAAPLLLTAFFSAHAAGPAAAPLNVEACKACHGPGGISVNPTIPNLAGQKPAYLEAQLKAFRSKDRRNDLMNVIAGQLNDAGIHELAVFWSSMPAVPSPDAAGRAPLSSAIHSRMEFPVGFPAGFTVYQTEIEEGVMTKRYANTAAVKAARGGRALPAGSVIFQVNYQAQKDAAGKDIAGAVQSYAGMESRGEWGKDIPLLLRNGDWDYALFAADGKRHDELNEAQCLACHKPKESDSYVFTMKQLREAPPS
jgi:cytochrome c553